MQMAKKEDKKQENLIRIMSTDINAEQKVIYGLAKIKGIGLMFSNALCEVLKLDKNTKIDSLKEKDIERIEEYLSNPQKTGLPNWMLNQRKEYTSGEDLHLISKDIDFNLLQLRRRVGKLKTYKSLRYKANLPVRGQRTKSNFRRNKMLASKKAKKGGK